MKNGATIETLKIMRFGAMAAELERQIQDPATYVHMGFENGWPCWWMPNGTAARITSCCGASGMPDLLNLVQQ